MAQEQEQPPYWDTSAVNLANEAFDALEKMFVKKRTLPLLAAQREAVLSIMATNARATMRWMAKLHVAGINIATADDEDTNFK